MSEAGVNSVVPVTSTDTIVRIEYPIVGMVHLKDIRRIAPHDDPAFPRTLEALALAEKEGYDGIVAHCKDHSDGDIIHAGAKGWYLREMYDATQWHHIPRTDPIIRGAWFFNSFCRLGDAGDASPAEALSDRPFAVWLKYSVRNAFHYFPKIQLGATEYCCGRLTLRDKLICDCRLKTDDNAALRAHGDAVEALAWIRYKSISHCYSSRTIHSAVDVLLEVHVARTMGKDVDPFLWFKAVHLAYYSGLVGTVVESPLSLDGIPRPQFACMFIGAKAKTAEAGTKTETEAKTGIAEAETDAEAKTVEAGTKTEAETVEAGTLADAGTLAAGAGTESVTLADAGTETVEAGTESVTLAGAGTEDDADAKTSEKDAELVAVNGISIDVGDLALQFPRAKHMLLFQPSVDDVSLYARLISVMKLTTLMVVVAHGPLPPTGIVHERMVPPGGLFMLVHNKKLVQLVK